MSNGQDTQNTQDPKDSKQSKLSQELDIINQTLAKMFPQASNIPTPQGGTVFPGRVGGAPPQLVGGNATGAGGSPIPQPAVPTPQSGVVPVSGLQTGFSFPNKQAAKAAGIQGGIENIAEAISKFKEEKDKGNIAKAQNYLQMMTTAYNAGDMYTADLYAKDPKVISSIEKYLKLDLKRVPKSQIATPKLPQGAPQGAQQPVPAPSGGINQPGGIALPKPSIDQQIQAMVKNMTLEGLKSGDPRVTSQFFGETAALTPEEYAKATKAKYGIELSKQQEATLTQESQLALAGMKTDVLKFIMGETAKSETAIDVANIHAGATVKASENLANSRLGIAKTYRDFLLKLKDSKPDTIEQNLYKGQTDLYKSMAIKELDLVKQAEKAGDKKASALHQTAADEWTKKSEAALSQYEAGKTLDEILKGASVPPKDDNDNPPPDDNNDGNTK